MSGLLCNKSITLTCLGGILCPSMSVSQEMVSAMVPSSHRVSSSPTVYADQAVSSIRLTSTNKFEMFQTRMSSIHLICIHIQIHKTKHDIITYLQNQLKADKRYYNLINPALILKARTLLGGGGSVPSNNTAFQTQFTKKILGQIIVEAIEI